MESTLEFSQTADFSTIQKIMSIRLQEPVNVTVTLLDDEDETDELLNNKNVEQVTNNEYKHIEQTTKKDHKQSYKRLDEIKDKEQNFNTIDIAETMRVMNTDALKTCPYLQICPSTVFTNDIIDPLEIVAENLISYIKLYSYYQSRYVNIVILQKRLRHTKYVYFTLSFQLILTHFLPKENDKVFLNRFVLKTLERSKMNISYIALYNLLEELLQWSKRKFNDVIKIIGVNPKNCDNQNSNTTASNVLNSDTPKQNNETVPNGDSTCLFTSGNPGQELSMNLNGDTHRHLNNDELKTRKRKLSEPNASPDIQKHKELDEHKPVRANDSPTVQSVFFTKQNIFQTETSGPGKENETLLSTSTPSDNGSFRPSYNFSTNLMNENNIGESELPEVLPSTSNLISLYPQESFKPPKVCQCCGRYTEFMCVGCYSQYYCSRKCQITDWQNHKNYCLSRKKILLNNHMYRQ